MLIPQICVYALTHQSGIMNPPVEDLTVHGHDLQFGTNVLGASSSHCFLVTHSYHGCSGHYFLTELLLPALLAGVESSPDKKARVVNLSSSAAYLGSLKNFDHFADTTARKNMKTDALYAESKLVSVYLVAPRYRYKLRMHRESQFILQSFQEDTRMKES